MTIILTPELAEIRIEARKIFPNHDFLPGDDCPAGQRVIRQNGETATILGPARLSKDSAVLHKEYWWEVETDEEIFHDLPGRRGVRKMRVLDWPPTLRKA